MREYLIQVSFGGGEILRIPSFGVFVLSAVLLASVLTYSRLRKHGLSMMDFSALWGFCVGFGFLGAILFGLLFSRMDFSTSRNVFLGELTLAVQGGVFVGTLAAMWMLRSLGRPVLKTLDLCVPPVFLGLAIGRFGCLFGGCCYGAPTGLPWGLVYPVGHSSHVLYGSQSLHPAPIYSAMIAGTIAALALIARRRRDGFVVTWSLVLYLLGRVALETVRGDHGQIGSGLSLQQLFSLVAIPLLLLWYYRLAPSSAEARARRQGAP